ncbi:HAD family phosphatase [Staphylococcus chromogenes]|nr:HAD family phosphatase [Staphylococcus chromogenes]
MNLLFDLYGVLLKTQTAEALSRLESTIGAGPEMWAAYWRLRPDYDAGRVSDEEYWASMQRELGLAPFDYEEARRADFDGWLAPDEEMIQFVLGLKQDGHRVGLLSNIPKGLAAEVRAQHTWLDKFDSVAMSCEIGAEKPSAAAYEIALDMLGTKAEDTHFFDDNQANVVAAQRAGLQAHLFRNIDDLKAVVQ